MTGPPTCSTGWPVENQLRTPSKPAWPRTRRVSAQLNAEVGLRSVRWGSMLRAVTGDFGRENHLQH